MRMSEDEAIDLFVAIRWQEYGGQPVCPHRDCGCEDIYNLTINRRTKAGVKKVRLFKCAACRRQFSPTSGTPFAHRKLELRDYLYAASQFVNGAKGKAALELCRNLGVQAKTAFVLLHKMREALGTIVRTEPLTGEVEIDGAGFGGKRRKANLVAKRKHSKTVPKERKSVVVIRQRGGETRAFFFPREADGVAAVLANVSRDAVIYADDAPGWNPLHGYNDVITINHTAFGFASAEANTNQAESFFSRMRRSQYGIHHRFVGHTAAYATEMAWRENSSRRSNGWQFFDLLHALSHSPVSRVWTGYWDYPGRAVVMAASS